MSLNLGFVFQDLPQPPPRRGEMNKYFIRNIKGLPFGEI
jgi:hypothetical protein